MDAYDKKKLSKDIIYTVLLLGPAIFMKWWDNWSSFQFFVIWDLAFIIGLLHDMRKEMARGTTDSV